MFLVFIGDLQTEITNKKFLYIFFIQYVIKGHIVNFLHYFVLFLSAFFTNSTNSFFKAFIYFMGKTT